MGKIGFYVTIFLVSVSFVCFTSCKKNVKPAPTSEVRFSNDVTFEDIPVPAGEEVTVKMKYRIRNIFSGQFSRYNAVTR